MGDGREEKPVPAVSFILRLNDKVKESKRDELLQEFVDRIVVPLGIDMNGHLYGDRIEGRLSPAKGEGTPLPNLIGEFRSAIVLTGVIKEAIFTPAWDPSTEEDPLKQAKDGLSRLSNHKKKSSEE